MKQSVAARRRRISFLLGISLPSIKWEALNTYPWEQQQMNFKGSMCEITSVCDVCMSFSISIKAEVMNLSQWLGTGRTTVEIMLIQYSCLTCQTFFRGIFYQLSNSHPFKELQLLGNYFMNINYYVSTEQILFLPIIDTSVNLRQQFLGGSQCLFSVWISRFKLI